MPLQATSGAASYDAFGGGAPAVPEYIEDMFSTYLYTGTGATQTITNGIDLSTKGGLVWIKGRSGATGNRLTDTARGATLALVSDTTAGEATQGSGLSAFGTTGFTIGSNASYNTSAATYASWTFRKQPKFFDIVTYTGTGSATMINHNLGSVPGMIIYKNLNTANNWCVYHRSISPTQALFLNLTSAAGTSPDYFGSQTATSTQFPIGNNDLTNAGDPYVAYLFAHNAGGFGLTGTDNVISCGSFTTDSGGNATVNLGYEPQWILIKSSSEANGWAIVDTMRGLPADGLDRYLLANSSAAEAGGGIVNINATGFYANATLSASATYIYIAIRRGPMKVPTNATKVFAPLALNNALNTVNTTGFPIDLQWYGNRDGNANNIVTVDRLRGVSTNTTQQQNYLRTASTAAEVTSGGSNVTKNWGSTGFWTASAQDGASAAYWNFQRAPSFFDEVCYTGTGSATTVTHNLGVAPELIIIKKRSNTADWAVLQTGVQKQLYLNGNYAGDVVNATYFGNDSVYVAPTSTVFSLGSSSGVNGVSGQTFVAYLFATCAGVSKVGSYTGTGTTKQVDCGFAAGARFVLIKRTDSTGDWYVWDSARGIVSGNDPYLLLNSTAAEVTNTDYIDTYSAGFEISSTAPAAINANGGSFIFLAIA